MADTSRLTGKTLRVGGATITLGACVATHNRHSVEGPSYSYTVADAPATVVCDQGARRRVTPDCRVSLHPHYGASLYRDDLDWGTEYVHPDWL